MIAAADIESDERRSRMLDTRAAMAKGEELSDYLDRLKSKRKD